MKSLLVIFGIFALAAAVKINLVDDNLYAIEFGRFMQRHNKQYVTADEQGYRFRVFKSNVEAINEHNRGDHGYTLAVNEFADMTNEEFRAKFLGSFQKTGPAPAKHTPTGSALPATVDWRTKGAVTPVKNQGQCGSCWSFSTTGSVEGAWFLSKGKLVSLSEQNLVDCSTAQGNNGCGGGLMDNAFKYIIAHGIDSESSYPYTARDGKCQFNPDNVVANISSFKDVISGSESDLQSAVAQQPTSVAIDASKFSFQFYKSGVYYESRCSATQLDHGVLAVGYGTENGKDYWLVKNSWGGSWGDQGYIKMSRNRNNNCGIATAASYPIV